MSEELKAAYEARYCPGMPADCCDYGVISHEAGKEVCRVWNRDDAELIADLLNTRPDPINPTALSDLIAMDPAGEIDGGMGEVSHRAQVASLDEMAEMVTAADFAVMRARAEQAEADLAAEREKVAYPDIGTDPMKLPRDLYRGPPAIERLKRAYVIQQKEVPDQTGLVWRADLGFAISELTRLYAWQETERDRDAAAIAKHKEGE